MKMRTFLDWNITCIVARLLLLFESTLDVLPRSTKHEDIFQIYDHKGINEWSQDIVHHPHECF
jgi:hypothetical protein